MDVDSDRMGRLGVHGVAMLVHRDLGWKFREQFESDYAIDAVVESAVDGRPTGRVVALQIKSGKSYFSEAAPGGGWFMRGPKWHMNRWLEFQMPVLVVLFDPGTGCAYWVHVSPETAKFTAEGYKLHVPATQVLDASAKPQIGQIAERWAPVRGDDWTRVRNAVARCLAEGIPVQPTSSLWEAFAANLASRATMGADFSVMPVQAYNLRLAGDAAAVELAADSGNVSLNLRQLRGTWSVPTAKPVYVFENLVVPTAAVQRWGRRTAPLVCLRGYPTAAAEYLLLGIGFCGARVRVHTDHDHFGTLISRTLFNRTIDYEEWCPSTRPSPAEAYEEYCLNEILDAIGPT